MKKVSTVAAKRSTKISEQKVTVGLDLGDRSSWYCMLKEAGSIVVETRSRKALPAWHSRAWHAYLHRRLV